LAERQPANFAFCVLFSYFVFLFKRKFGALQRLISLRQAPFWFLGRDRGRINNGSAYRLLF
jgi:hypothetical protein